MSKAISATELGLAPHYKVRIVVPGALLHVASSTPPKCDGVGVWVGDWIEDHRYGDTIGFIDWSVVTAVTWRWSE